MKHCVPNHVFVHNDLLTSNLLTILYRLIKSETTSRNGWPDNIITSFLPLNLQRTKTRKKLITFLKFSQGYLIFILYQLCKFEAHSCNFFATSSAITQNKRAFRPWVGHLRMTDQWSETICKILIEEHEEQFCEIILNLGQWLSR